MILKTSLTLVITIMVLAGKAAADDDLQKKVDSLFKIASSGSVLYADMVEPAKDSLAALGAPAVPLLIDKFTTKSTRAKWAVIFVLQRIGSPAVPDLVAALSRPDEKIVQNVCWALGDIADSSATLPLMAIANHECWQVRDQVIRAFGRIKDRRADEVVLKALNDTLAQVRKAAAVSCGQINLTGGIKKLVSLLGDDFYGVRMTALEALMKMDTSLVLPVLADSINSDNHLLGNLVCEMLGQYGSDEALELLLEQTDSGNLERRAHAGVAIIRADPDDNCGFRRLFYNNEKDRLVHLKFESAIRAAQNAR
ncbi:MAG: HEAT repeat domain-containing protein [Candidatus Zixiibacteriota bacterium]